MSQKKKIKYLVIHCTATPEGREVTKKDLVQWHIKERGWKQLGYSDLIHLDGTIENLVPYNDDEFIDPWEITNGASGFNSISRHVVYAGGSSKTKPKDLKDYPPKDTRTKQQIVALSGYVCEFLEKNPEAKVVGHNQLSNKACPSFSVPEFLRSIGVDKKNTL